MIDRPYEIVMDDVVEHMVSSFHGDFEAAVRECIPSLEEAERIEPLERDPWRFGFKVVAKDGEWEVVCFLQRKENRLVVLGVYPKLRELPPLSREEAVAWVEAGIGKGGYGMTGAEYVDSIWGRQRHQKLRD